MKSIDVFNIPFYLLMFINSLLITFCAVVGLITLGAWLFIISAFSLKYASLINLISWYLALRALVQFIFSSY